MNPQGLGVEKKDIGQVCEMYGLEPVKITSTEVFRNVLRYVNGIGAVSRTDYGIPLLYRPNDMTDEQKENKKFYTSIKSKDSDEVGFDVFEYISKYITEDD